MLMLMKKIIYLAFLLSIFVSCRKNEPTARMEFAEKEYDFGVITEGQKVQKDFKFINSSNTDLVISNVQGSCGCTIGEYPKDPVKPNEEGIIKVKFNSEGKFGKQEKSVTISANTENQKEMLKIFAEVQDKK